MTCSSRPRNAMRCAPDWGGLSPQQVGVPLWQAGPEGSAIINNVSPSQSAAISLTSRKWPEVSPLVQSRPLLPLQKVTPPPPPPAPPPPPFTSPPTPPPPLPPT